MKDESILPQEDISITFQTKEPQQNIFPHDSSLSINHEKTLSNQSQYISISLTSMMENESQYKHDLSTKRKPDILK